MFQDLLCLTQALHRIMGQYSPGCYCFTIFSVYMHRHHPHSESTPPMHAFTWHAGYSYSSYVHICEAGVKGLVLSICSSVCQSVYVFKVNNCFTGLKKTHQRSSFNLPFVFCVIFVHGKKLECGCIITEHVWISAPRRRKYPRTRVPAKGGALTLGWELLS